MMFRALIISILSFFVSATQAHTMGESYLFLSSYEHRVEAEVQMRLPDVMNMLGDKEAKDSLSMQRKVDSNIDQIKSMVLSGVHISGMNENYAVSYDRHKIMKTPIGEFLKFNMTFQANQSVPDILNVGYDLLFDQDTAHKAFIVIRFTERSGLRNFHNRVSVGFDAETRSREVDLVSGFTWTVLLDFIGSGAEHIIRGLDHMLFLLALVLQSVVMRKETQWQPVEGFKQAFLNIIKIITLFTLAHSITLSLGVLGYAQIPGRLTEGIIAASVIFMGLNILYPVVRERVGWLIFGFGLFHGLGFASNLDYLDITKGDIVIPLAGFNLGVEAGQLTIIVLVFPILYLMSRKSFYSPLILRPGALVITLIALLWLAERILGIDGLAPDELPISLFSAE